MKYKEIALLPNLAIKELALNTPGGRITVKQWKDVPFTVEDFNFEEYRKDNFPDLVDWDSAVWVYPVYLLLVSDCRRYLERASSHCTGA